MMPLELRYADSLVKLTKTELELKNYFFPLLNSKHVSLHSIHLIRVLLPTVHSGRFRLWGTRDFAHWYPLDIRRPLRDRIYQLLDREGKTRIGFTVEHPDRFEDALIELDIRLR